MEGITYRYDECSRLSEKRFASGPKTSIGYNAEGKLREIVHQNPEEQRSKTVLSPLALPAINETKLPTPGTPRPENITPR